ncbi:MAG: HNH endonuclease [Saprospiraceae bacterium]|jgi:hypothetical protein|nr:HNH endonuclease [Saprospiraceae bacterium]
MSRYIPETVRLFVAERANYRCEYCRIPAADSFFPFHIDHIVSLKHGGSTEADNLAYCCQICNLNKGTDIATYLQNHSTPIRFFNPRTDAWADHFEIDETGAIYPRTSIAEATIKILDLNHPENIIERRELIKEGLFS